MPETRFDAAVRHALRTEADAQTFSTASVRPAAARARRRLARNAIIVVAVAILLTVGSLGAMRMAHGTTPISESHPTLPHGDGRIAFISTDRHDVFTVEPDGSGMIRLTACGVPICGSVAGLAWSPDGSTLLFTRWRDKFDPADTNVGLFSISADGTGLHRLTDCTPPACQDFGGAWSPDGARVAFTREGSGAGLYVVSLDGSGLTKVAPGRIDGRPAWSPDGEGIAFDQRGVISLAEADGSGVSQLVSGPRQLSQPAWSPDGTRLSYSADGPSSAQIWSIGADGTDRHLLYSADGCCADSVWSPTGSSIAFSFEPNARTVMSFVIATDGSDLRRLAGSTYAPVWSPSGARIAECAGGTLISSSPDGTDRRTLVDRIGLGCVAWQPV
jgi:Tol biopolymer transport system component